MKLRDSLIIGALSMGMAACGGDEKTTDSETPEANAPVEQIGKGGPKKDAWDNRNDPDVFERFLDKEMSYTLADLPRAGEAANKPWPASYWPTYQDSSNHRWRGADELSPLEKFDVVYNGWDASTVAGKKPFNRDNCEDGFDADYYTNLGPAAGWMSERKGNKRDRDQATPEGTGCSEELPVETWWGLCHAWAPASIVEAEPIYPVTKDGVTFYPADIKALILTVYDSSRSVLLGGRCNEKDPERDENGRIIATQCRDTNAGSFHVVAANLLGRYSMSYLEDRTYDYEVWNQPILSFNVTQMEEISAAQANELMGIEGETYTFNDKAKAFRQVQATIKYITESHQEERALIPELQNYVRTDNYEYILELDADGEIIGGEWLSGRAANSRFSRVSDQPDFLWATTGPNTSWSRANPHVSYDKVKELLALSRVAPGDDAGGDTGDTQTFSSETVIDIPDNDPAGINSDILIQDSVDATTVSVQVDIKHTYIGDLEITLSGPNGFSKVLKEKRVGRSADDINEQYPVAELAGALEAGTYTLSVTDNARIDTGKLLRWAIVAN